MRKGLGFRISCIAVLAAAGLESPPARGGDPSCEPTWTEVPAPTVGDNGASALGSIAVVSDDDIWAAGNFVEGDGYRTLIEHWDGKKWSVVPSVDGEKKITFLT